MNSAELETWMKQLFIWIYLENAHWRRLEELLVRTTGHDKDKALVILSTLGDGTKISPLVIFKGVKPPKLYPTRGSRGYVQEWLEQ